MDEDKSAMENMQDNTEILPIVENSLENIKQAMDEQTAVVVDANDEKNREMNAIYESQDKAIRSKYADMWKTIQESEMQGKSSLEEIDALNRKQYQDNVESVARKASGRKSSLAGQMSAQGFDASVIANMAGQIDSQYADERLAVQNQHIGNLQKTYESYKALYDDLLANKQNLTNNERTFMESVAARMKALKDTEVEMAKMESQSYQPLIDFNKQLLAAYSTAQTSDATAAGYESSWKV